MGTQGHGKVNDWTDIWALRKEPERRDLNPVGSRARAFNCSLCILHCLAWRGCLTLNQIFSCGSRNPHT